MNIKILNIIIQYINQHNEKVISLISLSVALIVIIASFFQWWNITYDGNMNTKKWVKIVFAVCGILITFAILLIFTG